MTRKNKNTLNHIMLFFIIIFAYLLRFLNEQSTYNALFGTLLVLGIFLLSKEIFRSYRAGLISAYLTTFSFWAIGLSVLEIETIAIPVIITFSLFFLLKGFRVKKYLLFIISGLILGLGIYLPMVFEISLALAVILIFFVLIFQKNFLRSFWKRILIFSTTILIIISPLFWTQLKDSDTDGFSSSITTHIQTQNNNFNKSINKNKNRVFLKYNFVANENWSQSSTANQLFDPLTGMSFIVGFIYLIIKAFHLIYLRFKHNVYDRKMYIYLLILSWFSIITLLEISTIETSLNTFMTAAIFPSVIIISTIPFLWLLGKISKESYSLRTIFTTLLAIAFIFIGIFNMIKYFSL